MKYTVVTSSVADHQLAEIWLKAADRQSIADAFDRVECSLKNDPHLQGQAHPSGWRLISAPPLTVAYRISEADRLVKILSLDVRS